MASLQQTWCVIEATWSGSGDEAGWTPSGWGGREAVTQGDGPGPAASAWPGTRGQEWPLQSPCPVPRRSLPLAWRPWRPLVPTDIAQDGGRPPRPHQTVPRVTSQAAELFGLFILLSACHANGSRQGLSRTGLAHLLTVAPVPQLGHGPGLCLHKAFKIVALEATGFLTWRSSVFLICLSVCCHFRARAEPSCLSPSPSCPASHREWSSQNPTGIAPSPPLQPLPLGVPASSLAARPRSGRRRSRVYLLPQHNVVCPDYYRTGPLQQGVTLKKHVIN